MNKNQMQTFTKNTHNDRVRAVGQILHSKMNSIVEALPKSVGKYLTPERVVKVGLITLTENPTLASCTEASIIKAIINLASVGLEPGGPLGQAYLVPYKNNRTDRYEAQSIIGYRGLISLARRSGDVASIVAQVVYERDEFDLDFASECPVKHKPYLKGDRGKPIGAYCLARFKDGSVHPEFMSMADIEKIRRRSKAANNGPWSSDYEEMAKKTVVRRAAKYWPLTVEFAEAIHIDNQTDSVNIDNIIDASFETTEQPQSVADKALLMLQGEKKEGKLIYDELATKAKAIGVQEEMFGEWCQELYIVPSDKRSHTEARLLTLSNYLKDFEGWDKTKE